MGKSKAERREARQERRAARAASKAPAAPSWQSAMDQRAASGQTVGDQWFNSVGGSAADRNAAINYAASRGYSMGNAWGAQASPFGRPATVQDSYRDAGSGKSYGTRFIPGTGEDGLGVWAAGPMSDAQIRGMFGSQAPGAAQGNPVTAGAATEGGEKASKKSKFKDIKSVRQGLLIAGLNGNVNKRELAQISEATGKDTGRVINQLDKLNKKKGLSIGLGNAAVKGLLKNPFPLKGFGEGKLGAAVSDYWMATNTPTSRQGYDKETPGMKQSQAGLIPLQGGAYQLDAKGKYSPKTANKLFMSNYLNKFSSPAPAPAPATATDPATAATAPTAATGAPTGEVMGSTGAFDMPQPPEDPSVGGGGALGGGEGYGGASYLRSPRSRWKKLGISTRGVNALSRGLNYSNMFGR